MSETTTPQRGLIYYRVSTEEQAQHGISLEQQESACREYAKRHGIEIVGVFHDDGVSAKTADREGLQSMLARCTKKAKEIDCVIVYKVDRLSRNVNDYSSILVLLTKLGIKLASTTEAIDETPAGQFIGNVMAANAQFDNQIRGERTRDCMMTKVEKGYWQWRAPIGYRNALSDGGEKVVTPDPARAEHIAWAFGEYAKGLSSLEDIRQEVNERGLRTRQGMEISPQLTSKIIRNVFYTGKMVVKGQEYIGLHAPLVDGETFALCQELLRGTPKEDAIAKRRSNEAFPLRHGVVCGFCGRPITASFSRGKAGTKYPYYRCYYKDCPSKIRSIPKDRFEGEFADYIASITPKKSFLAAFRSVILDVWREQYETVNGDRARLTADLERLESEKKSLIVMKRKELIPDDDFRSEFEDLKAQIEKVQVGLSRTRLETFNVDEAVSYVFGFLERLPEVWTEADFETKQQLQCLIFPEKPVYGYPGFETPKLSLILQLKTTSHGEKSLLVARRGIEPLFPH